MLKTVTIADFTFVVNTSITAAMDSTLSGGTGTKAIIFINQATADTTYSVTIDGVTVTDNTSGDSTLSTDTIAADLKSGLDSGLSGFTIARNGPVLYVRKSDNSNFSIDGSDTQGDSKMTIIKDSVQRFTDQPTVSPNGYVVEIKGEDDTAFSELIIKIGNSQDFQLILIRITKYQLAKLKIKKDDKIYILFKSTSFDRQAII